MLRWLCCIRARGLPAWVSGALLAVGAVGAQAQSLTVASIEHTGCTNGAFGFRLNRTGMGAPSGPWRVRTVVNQGAQVFMDQIFPAPPGASNMPDGWTNWFVFAENQGGTVNASFPMPDNLPFTMTLSTLDTANRVVSSSATTATRCGPGAQIVAAAAVPALPLGGLAVLSALLPVVGWRRLRRAVG